MKIKRVDRDAMTSIAWTRDEFVKPNGLVSAKSKASLISIFILCKNIFNSFTSAMFIDLKIFSIILDVSAIFKLDAKTTFLEIFLYRALPSNLQFNEYPEYIFGVLYKSYFKVLSLIFSSGLIRSANTQGKNLWTN